MLTVDLSISVSVLWLVLPVVSHGQVLLLDDCLPRLHLSKWRWPDFFLLLLSDKVGLCYSCILHGVLVHLDGIGYSFCCWLFLFISHHLSGSSFLFSSVFCFCFPFFKKAACDGIGLFSLLSLCWLYLHACLCYVNIILIFGVLLDVTKACVLYFLSNFIFSSNDSPLKIMRNVFYFK